MTKAKTTKSTKTNGYRIFCSEERAKIKENEDITGPEVMKELGRRWSALADEEKAEYNEKATEQNSSSGEEKPKKKKSELAPIEHVCEHWMPKANRKCGKKTKDGRQFCSVHFEEEEKKAKEGPSEDENSESESESDGNCKEFVKAKKGFCGAPVVGRGDRCSKHAKI
jgi:hypothetical protein